MAQPGPTRTNLAKHEKTEKALKNLKNFTQSQKIWKILEKLESSLPNLDKPVRTWNTLDLARIGRNLINLY